jgi:ankyrin repeat protein
MKACENNLTECVVILIEAGADVNIVNIKNKKRKTTLSIANGQRNN